MGNSSCRSEVNYDVVSEPVSFDGDTCSTDGCGKKTRARGFCVACYYRNLRSGELDRGSPTRRWKHRLSNIDPVERLADCTTCGRIKIHKRDKGWRCSTEANARSRLYKRAYRASRHKAKSCQICHSRKRLVWDHDHATGEHRGTLCSTCNTGLGMFQDNPALLVEAALYLLARELKVMAFSPSAHNPAAPR